MTELLAWFNPTRWIALAVVAGSLVLGYNVWEDHQQGIGEARANARWKTATDQLKKDAAATLATATAQAHAAEQALQDFKNQQEIKDARNQTTVAGLADRLRVLAGPSGRLRDPNATAGCWCGSDIAQGQTTAATDHRADDRAEAGGLLSEQLSELLFERLREADAINIAYIACRADTSSVRVEAQPK